MYSDPEPVRWTRIEEADGVRALSVTDASVIVALADGRFLRSLDGGLTWAAGATRIAWPVTSLLARGDVLLVGTLAGLYRARWDGALRPASRFPQDAAVTVLTASDPLLVGGTLRAGVFRSSRDGRVWERASHGMPYDGSGLQIYDAALNAHGVFVAHALGVSRSSDGGQSWHTGGIGLPLSIPHAALLASGTLLFANIDGRLYQADVAAEPPTLLVWKEVGGAVDGEPVLLLTAAHGALFGAARRAPYLFRSTDGGETWAGVVPGPPAMPQRFVATPKRLLAVLEDETLWSAPPSVVTDAPLYQPQAVLRDVRGAPAADGSEITFVLTAPSEVTVSVHDLFDREVLRLEEGRLGAGTHVVHVGRTLLPPGLYRCRVRVGADSRAVSFALLG